MKRYPANFDELVYLTDGAISAAWAGTKAVGRGAAAVGRGLTAATAAGLKGAGAVAGGSLASDINKVRQGGIGGVLSSAGNALAGEGKPQDYSKLDKVLAKKLSDFYTRYTFPAGLPKMSSKMHSIDSTKVEWNGTVILCSVKSGVTTLTSRLVNSAKDERTYTCVYTPPPSAAGNMPITGLTITQLDKTTGTMVNSPEASIQSYIVYNSKTSVFEITAAVTECGYIEATAAMVGVAVGGNIRGVDTYTGATITGKVNQLIKGAPLLTGKAGDVWKIDITTP